MKGEAREVRIKKISKNAFARLSLANFKGRGKIVDSGDYVVIYDSGNCQIISGVKHFYSKRNWFYNIGKSVCIDKREVKKMYEIL